MTDDKIITLQLDKSLFIHGLGSTKHLSAYDMPVRAQVRCRPSVRQLTVTFEYLDDEPARELDLGRNVHMSVGRHSGKIFSLTGPVRLAHGGLLVGGTFNNFDRILDERRSKVSRYNQRANADLIRTTLRDTRGVVAQAVAQP